ncbi:MAG: hypothetical protein HN712_18160 [Gemmatimonadetes bacterium]|jgi:hypothetical protein|nr:hypothetical protein [Gemmatimonadota bacterium]MBT6144916.1 hypothetical protein [Gemmatimonadota bacterium]MBT7862248.1 hypothetical protein [Gemmatimonadota bacterium]
MLRSSILALLLTSASLSAQITLDAESLRLPIGTTFTIESFILQGSMLETGISQGPAGPDQAFDLTGPIDGLRILLHGTVIPLEEAPGSDQHPTADYAARYDIENPDGSLAVSYAYFRRGEQGDVAVAIDGNGTSQAPSQDSPIPIPMEFGASWEGVQTPVANEVLPGVELVGTLTQSGEIDAWGTVSIPAGEFPYLRIFSNAVGVTKYQGDPDLEAIGDLELATQGFSWVTYHLGTVLSMIQTATSSPNGTLPPSVTTQVIRIIEAGGLPSVITAIGWAQLKGMDHAAFQRTTP